MERIPPFQPGDKVIRIGRSIPQEGIINGDTYVVEDIWYCCNSIGYRITLINIPINFGGVACLCIKCGKVSAKDPYVASNFRKIDNISNHTTESLLEELSVPVREPQPA